MKVTLSWQEVVHACQVGMRRTVASLQKGSKDLHGASKHNEAKKWYYTMVGACAELAVAKAYNLYWKGGINQPKSEADVGEDLQVRWTGRPEQELIIREGDPENFRYVLVTGEIPHFEVHGYIWGSVAKCPDWLGDRAGFNMPAYWVPKNYLNVGPSDDAPCEQCGDDGHTKLQCKMD